MAADGRAQAARLVGSETHRWSGRPDAPLAAERNANALHNFVGDNRQIELALVDKDGDVGTDAELDLHPDRRVAGGELPQQ
jgi:hypothetical protein